MSIGPKWRVANSELNSAHCHSLFAISMFSPSNQKSAARKRRGRALKTGRAAGRSSDVSDKPHFEVESDGALTAGPLLLPGSPGTFDASWRTVSFCFSVEFAPEPVVPDGFFTAGPLLLPGCPGIPAPEFPGGTVACDGPLGGLLWAVAADVAMASATAHARNLNMGISTLFVN
jgi:hypothetical protein